MNEASRIQKLLNDQNAEIDRLKARIEKLEAALREIAGMDELSVEDYEGTQWMYQRVACKALEGKDE